MWKKFHAFFQHNFDFQNWYSLNTYKCHNSMSLPFYNQFWSFFWPLYNYLSQNLGADCHFVVLKLSKSELDQRSQHKSKTFLFPLFSILEEKVLKIYDSKMGNVLSFLVIVCQIHENLSHNWGSDGHFNFIFFFKFLVLHNDT